MQTSLCIIRGLQHQHFDSREILQRSRIGATSKNENAKTYFKIGSADQGHHPHTTVPYLNPSTDVLPSSYSLFALLCRIPHPDRDSET